MEFISKFIIKKCTQNNPNHNLEYLQDLSFISNHYNYY